MTDKKVGTALFMMPGGKKTVVPRMLLKLTVESAKEAILSVLCVRKPHLAHDDDGGNVHKLNETKKLNQAMVPVTLIQGL